MKERAKQDEQDDAGPYISFSPFNPTVPWIFIFSLRKTKGLTLSEKRWSSSSIPSCSKTGRIVGPRVMAALFAGHGHKER